MLHFYFENYGLGESEAVLNADNCVGQNKNHIIYLLKCWRVLSGLHKKIRLHFLVVGHTKFSPDYGAGVFKKLFRWTPCAVPEDVADCAKKSTILESVITGSTDGKESFVPMYDWQTKFSKFKTVPNLKKFHLFEFSSDKPGIVTCQEHSNAAPVTFTIVGSEYSNTSLPPVLPVLGLSDKRQSYLYEKIRQFVPEDKRDLLCPLLVRMVEADHEQQQVDQQESKEQHVDVHKQQQQQNEESVELQSSKAGKLCDFCCLLDYFQMCL